MAGLEEMTSLLDQSQNEIFFRLLPLIVFMAVVCVMGIIGNILTIIFYASSSRRSTSTIQIACLATVDLMVCVMIIPNIIEMAVNVKYNISFLCKLTHFFGLWTIASSCFILWVIALDRYRKICKPFAKQMTVKTTEYAVTAIVIGSFVLSVRNFVNFTAIDVNVAVSNSNETVKGRFCTTRDDAGYKISVTVFYAIDFLFVLVCLGTILITYSCIICTLLRLKRTKKRSKQQAHVGISSRAKASIREESDGSLEMSNFQSQTNASTSKTNNNLSFDDTASSSADFSQSRTTQAIGNGGMLSPISLRRTLHKMNFRKRKRRHKIGARSASERNLTFMMLTVSLLFVLCFFPYFVVKIIMRLVLKSGEEFELNVGIQFALRLVYLNSVFNPVVYCFFNPQFRSYIKGILLKCLRCQVMKK
ncbi:cholecystokinin receptor type A-like [Mercenaria mercenaria]|uniref:cholecystokinin receptor type A-like n=1 Tax=Mercenaria mercenaria TaxID=6596 RepID=UPI00234F6F5F|nr:cholecystokinin receptor type A-like [Mercenaria mercenaria]